MLLVGQSRVIAKVRLHFKGELEWARDIMVNRGATGVRRVSHGSTEGE